MYEIRYGHLLILILVLLILFLISRVISLKRSGRMKRSAAATKVAEQALVGELQAGYEAAGFRYDAKQNLFYSPPDCWQRQFGYCEFYDEAAAPMGIIIDREPIFFDYAQKRWLIEFWKGQYVMMTGAEIGVYTAPLEKETTAELFSGLRYDSADPEDFLQLSFILEKDGKPLYERSGLHWWLTGFLPGLFSEPDELTMHIHITLKDEEMCRSFLNALYQKGYTEHEIMVKCPSVLIKFETPRTPRPNSRVPVTDLIIQEKNKAFCELYEIMTKDIDQTLDRLRHIQKESPALYSQLLKIGKPRSLFEASQQGFSSKS